MIKFFGSWRNPLEVFESGVEIARVTPSLPQWGRQPKGASPLNPHERLDFSLTLPKNDPQPLLHGASPDEAVSARGPIAIRLPVPSFSFLTSMISHENKLFSYDTRVLSTILHVR